MGAKAMGQVNTGYLRETISSALAKRDEMVARAAVAARLRWEHQLLDLINAELDLLEAAQDQKVSGDQ